MGLRSRGSSGILPLSEPSIHTASSRKSRRLTLQPLRSCGEVVAWPPSIKTLLETFSGARSRRKQVGILSTMAGQVPNRAGADAGLDTELFGALLAEQAVPCGGPSSLHTPGRFAHTPSCSHLQSWCLVRSSQVELPKTLQPLPSLPRPAQEDLQLTVMSVHRPTVVPFPFGPPHR